MAGFISGIRRGGEYYFVNVSSDGSGYHYLVSIRETPMNQDVVYTAAEIENLMKSEGQVWFYNIYFDTDKSTLQPTSAPAIEAIGSYLKANPDVKVYMVVHTDNTGTLDYNLKLPKGRAKAVVTELAGKHSIPSAQLVAEGVGPLSPVQSNQTEESRAKNRRVVMVLAK